MPRVSDKRLLIEWFLETLQPELRECQHVLSETFSEDKQRAWYPQ